MLFALWLSPLALAFYSDVSGDYIYAAIAAVLLFAFGTCLRSDKPLIQKIIKLDIDVVVIARVVQVVLLACIVMNINDYLFYLIALSIMLEIVVAIVRFER